MAKLLAEVDVAISMRMQDGQMDLGDGNRGHPMRIVPDQDDPPRSEGATLSACRA